MDTYKKIITYIQEKLAHPGVIKHSRSMGWMFFARIGSIVISFLVTAYIARHLGPKNYGELSYAISFVSLFSFIASLGIDQILHRDLIRFPERKNEYLGSAIGLRIIASTAMLCVITLSTFLFSSEDVSLFLIFIISLSPLLGSFQLLSYEFQAETKSKYPSILSLLVVIILNICKVITIYLDQGVIYLALIVILEPILYSLGYMYLKWKIYKDLSRLYFNKARAILILKDSYPLMIASAFYVIYTRIDQVMLKHMIDAQAVGLYDSAVRLSEFSYFIPQIILVSLFPAIINAKKTSDELYHTRLKNLLILILSISIGIALITALLSKYLILIIFGSAFISAVPALIICAWSTVGASLNSLAQQMLLAENMSKNISIGTLAGMVTNISLNLVFIPKYGISGAALATLISYFVPFLCLFLFTKTRVTMLKILRA